MVRIRTREDFDFVAPGLADEILVNANLVEHLPGSTAAAAQLSGLPYSIDPVLTRFQLPAWWRHEDGRPKGNFAGTGLDSIVDMRIVKHTLRELVQDLERLSEHRDELEFDARVNVFENTLDVQVTDARLFRERTTQQRVSIPSTARVVVVASLSVATTAMYGGRLLNEQSIYGNEICTSGFSVRSPTTGVHGLTTAGHCENNMTYAHTGEVLTFVDKNQLTGYDTQWHRRANATFPNKAWDGSPDWRWILGKRGRTNQSVGDYVCHWGRSTGSGCGNIIARNANLCNNASGAVTGILVHNVNNKDLATGGDSGGPWYTGDIALGTSSCSYWVDGHGHIDASYMAANYIESGLGVVIKTTP